MSKKTTEEEKRYYPLDWDEAAIVGLTNQGEPVVEDVSIPVDTRQRLFSPNVRVQPMGGSAPEAKSDPAVQTELERRLAETQSMLAGMQASADIAAQQQAAQDAYAGHFANLLAQNEAYRQQQSRLWEQREKESRSRQTIAAVSDALSSLGNLVGTSRGAFNQPQTYQMPFVQRGIEQERALARNTADRLRATDLSLQNGAAGAGLNNPFALENLRHQNKMAQIQANAANATAIQDAITARNDASIASRNRNTDENNRTRVETTTMRNESNEKRTADTNQTRRDIAELRSQNGGNVGGYTTETEIHRNEYGQETGRTTTRTPASRPGVTDQPSTKKTEKKGGFNPGTKKKEEKEEKKEKKGGFRTK